MDDKGIKQWPDSYPNEEIISADITKNELFVAEVGPQIAAMVVLSPNTPDAYNDVDWKYSAEKINSIHRLAVHPELKTASMARDLMNYAEKKANDEGYTLIRLDTYSLNSIANTFYKKMGYHYCGDINLQYMPEKYFCYEKRIG